MKNFDSFGLKLFDRIIEEGYEESPKEGKHEERKVGVLEVRWGRRL